MLKKYPVVFLILFLAVGYASVTTKLIIDGDINVTFDDNNFIVEIVNSLATNGTTSLSDDKKSVDFKTSELKNINNEAILSFNIANKSKNYDANVTVNCTLKNNSTSLNEYFDMNLNIKNPINIEAGSEQKVILTIKMKKNYTGTNGITPEVSCAFDETPTSRDKEGNKYIPTYKENTLNGADPVLDAKELVPVTLANDGTVTYADTKKEWYNYANKKWANAVILVDTPSKTYNVNDEIKESDIESYFVWIPRFRYLIFNDGNYTSSSNKLSNSIAQEIQIAFENKETAVSKGTTKGMWLTHPAFTNYNTEGIWVGKFETGYKGATSTSNAEQNVNDSSKVIIKPNVYSWRGITVSNMFKTSYDYNRYLDSHMMRNTEWGAVAYLSHSKYGINTKIRINNDSSCLTGYAANTDKTSATPINNSAYNTKIGYLASTTGNITGVYDMSGGAWEYVTGYRANTPKDSGFTTSELTSDVYSKYFEVYPSDSTSNTYNYRILGDATGEMGPFYSIQQYFANNWYSEYSLFVNYKWPWFIRGGYHGFFENSGQFAFSQTGGQGSDTLSFRITLAPKN